MREMLQALPVVLALVATAAASGDEDAVDPLPRLAAEEVRARWHSRMDGRHFVAHVRMIVDLDGLHEERRLSVYRDDEGDAAERVLIRFEAPPELRKLGLLYLEHADRPNDYFLYRPAVRRVRRLSQRAVTSNLYGIDPEFLGFGLAETQPTRIDALDAVDLDGRGVYRLQETALQENDRFDQRTVWLDPRTFIPLRTEHRRAGRTVLRASTLQIGSFAGVATPIRMRFEQPVERREVELAIERVDYRTPIPEQVFSIFAMTKSEPGGAGAQGRPSREEGGPP